MTRLPRIGKRTARNGARIEWNLASTPSHIRIFNAKGRKVTHITGTIPESELIWELKVWKRRHPDQLKMTI